MNDFKRRVFECAKAYAEKGWAVLPVHTIIDGKCTCGKANCSSAGKHPATPRGVKDATTDLSQIERWFGSDRVCNIGIAAGSASGLAVLDIDPKDNGDESIKQYSVPDTLEVITGSGGTHYYFADPDGTTGNSVGKLGSGIDVRGNNGYVVAPPSLHLSGNEYRWRIDPNAKELAPVPSWLNASGSRQEAVGSRKNADEVPIAEGKRNDQTRSGLVSRTGTSNINPNDDNEKIPEGTRNDKLCSVAGTMRRQGCDEAVIYTALIDINKRRCQPPVAFDELKRIAQSVSRYVPEPKNQQGTVLNDDHPETLSAAFHTAADDVFRFNPIDGWSILENDKYRRMDEGEITVALRQWLNAVYIRKLIGKEWVNVRFKKNRSKIKDILAELGAMVVVYIPADKHAPACFSGDLDTRHIIAANNCLLDIKALPAKQEALTKDFYTLNYLPFDYAPEAQCPQWQAFLGSIFTKRQLSKKTEYDAELGDFVEQYEHVPDELAIEILGEWFGYLLSGQTHLQKIFALIGEKRSGKGTIGRVLRALNGSVNTASPTLSSLTTDFSLQGLMNKTIAVIGDANTAGRSGDSARAVERLKSISGEDGQQINRKNKDYIEVDKLSVRFVLMANKMQDLRDSTGALASRFNILVTTQSFLGREDLHLIDRLMTELPGIFNWAMEGLGRLRKRRFLTDHPAGVEARDDFEEMSSPMKAFIADWCIVSDNASVPVDVLWESHNQWARENGNKSYSKRKFIVEIKGACGGINRGRKRVQPGHMLEAYLWPTPENLERIGILDGIDLRKEYRTAWKGEKIWPNDPGSGPGYPSGY